MRHKTTAIALILVFATFFIVTGCYKDTTVVVKPAEITRTVSFTKDIIPIFSKNCALAGCHTAGGQVPDLTANNAYRGIVEQDLVDVATPENSEIYGWLTGTIKPAMPLGAASDPSSINELILAWIKQGAKNN